MTTTETAVLDWVASEAALGRGHDLTALHHLLLADRLRQYNEANVRTMEKLALGLVKGDK